MARWKYIMLKTDQGDLYPVIFPEAMMHQSVAEEAIRRLEYFGADDETMGEGLQAAVRHQDVAEHRREWRNAEPVSAGFIDSLEVVGVGGRSDSLDLDSRAGDKYLINGVTNHVASDHKQRSASSEQELAVTTIIKPKMIQYSRRASANIQDIVELVELEGHQPSCKRYRTRRFKQSACTCGATKD